MIQIGLLIFVSGVSVNIVPATYKQKKAALIAPPKGADGDEKAEAPAEDGAAAAEGETPAGMGRGNR